MPPQYERGDVVSTDDVFETRDSRPVIVVTSADRPPRGDDERTWYTVVPLTNDSHEQYADHRWSECLDAAADTEPGGELLTDSAAVPWGTTMLSEVKINGAGPTDEPYAHLTDDALRRVAKAFVRMVLQ